MNLDFVFDAFASALSFLYDATSSYGLSIMLLTLGVMVIVTPLTLKSTRSMISMQQMQPEIRKLQNKYKDDRQKLNEEMMAFYKEHDISPLGGCLPLIIQTPIFIILYRVLTGLTQMQPYGHDMGTAAGLLIRNPSGGGEFANFGTFDPSYLDHSSALYQSLSVSRTMNFLGVDLADSFMQTLGSGLVKTLPYVVLVAIVAVSAWYQQRQIMSRNSGNQTQINPQQQMLMKIMPFFLPFFSLTLPAGIVLYFVVSNLYRIAQQAFITRTMYSEEAKAQREAAFQARLKKNGGDDGSANGKGKGQAKAKAGGSAKGASAAKGGAGAKGGSGAKGKAAAKGSATNRNRSNGSAKKGDAPAPSGSSMPTKRRRDKGPDLTKDDGDTGASDGSAAETPTDTPSGNGADGDRSTGTSRPSRTQGRSPNRQAPSRQAPPAENRSKDKRKRR